MTSTAKFYGDAFEEVMHEVYNIDTEIINGVEVECINPPDNKTVDNNEYNTNTQVKDIKDIDLDKVSRQAEDWF